ELRRGPPGDRPHPPDPRPFRRHRPPARGGFDLRRQGPLQPGTSVPPCPSPGLPPPADRSAARLRLAAPGGPLRCARGGPRGVGVVPTILVAPVTSSYLYPRPERTGS